MLPDKLYKCKMRFSISYFIAIVLFVLCHGQKVTALPSEKGPSISPDDAPVDLQKRLGNQWQSFLAPNGWEVTYITFAHFIPIQVAAFSLQGLYQSVIVHAVSNQIADQAPSNAIMISFGDFSLTLSSDQKIPWALLQAFAARMWTLTGMGFTPGYTVSFVSPSGTSLRANLRVSGSRGQVGGKPAAPKPYG
ncbi:hypothetical protein ACLMJK_005289 [Lecanora helva]